MAKKEKLSLEELLEQALVKEEDQLYDVPNNWVWVRLGSIIKVSSGNGLTTSKMNFDGMIPVYGGNGITGTHDLWNIEEPTIVIGRVGFYCGCVHLISEKAWVTDNALIVHFPKKYLLIKYLYWLLNNTNLRQNDSSTAQPVISGSKIYRLPIPLVPILEQQRIVTLIESLFEKLDHAKELVQSALDSFENRKSAIMHKAFTGGLTEKWRRENCLIPVKSILKDIEEERYNLQKKNSINKSFSYKKSVQIEIQGKTKGIDTLFELPSTWEWVSLGQVTWNISDGPHFSPNYVEKEGGVPIISARNVKYKNIDFSDAKYVSNEDYQEFIKRGKPEIGDVLFTKGGTTGIPTTVDEDGEFCIWVHVALLKIIKKYVSAEYVRDVLASSILYRQSQEQTHGVGNQDLGLTRMIYMALPLPPLAEQQEIVRILDTLLENEQKAKELCDVIEKIDHMKKSILARAFRGELSTNDPAEESALELLKEVLIEKA